MNYCYRLPPLECQRQAFAAAVGKPAFGYLMDQGTGKTKAALDDAFNLALYGAINCLVVIAPNDVHRAWITEELPKHAVDEVPVTAVIWDGKRTKKKAAEIETLFRLDNNLKMLALNVEAFAVGKPASNRAAQLVKRLLHATTAMLVVDESQDIKTPKSQRTRTIVNHLAKHAAYRRILTGTPITQTPFDFYSQFRFLDPNILGFSTFSAFKAEYGSFIRKRSPHKRMNPKTGQMEDIYYDDLLSYKNIDKLLEKVRPYCFRVEKRDALPDLPKKVYMPPRRVDLSPAQKRIYKQLLEDGIAEVRMAVEKANANQRYKSDTEDELWSWLTDETAPKIVAESALIVDGKLRQITAGVMRDSSGVWHRVEDKPPKLRAMMSDIEHNGEPAIIWCLFREECELVADALRAEYGEDSTVVFHGGMTADERAASKAAFQDMDGPTRYFVTSYAAARGHTLLKATATYYHTVSDSVDKRIQSEDRNHRAGAVGQLQDGGHCVLYTDYTVAGTVDDKRYDQTMENVKRARGLLKSLK